MIALWDPREKGTWPKMMKGAGSMKLVIWKQGTQKIATGSREQLKIIQWSKGNYKGAKGKKSREQGIKRNEKGAPKIVKKEQNFKNQKGAERVR